MFTKTCLEFDLFQNFVEEAQSKIKGNKFCDATLARVHNQFEAHKVILSSTVHYVFNTAQFQPETEQCHN